MLRFVSQLTFHFLLLSVTSCIASAEGAEEFPWTAWSDEVFLKAERSNKFVLLNLEAFWCHWCHVMNNETYADENIRALVTKHFIPIRVDQDSRPDLSARYKKSGWPATVIFSSKGEELFIGSGYIESAQLLKTLKQVISTPQASNTAKSPTSLQVIREVSSVLDPTLKQELLSRHVSSFDQNLGGLKTKNKFLDVGALEYSLLAARNGSNHDREMAELSLTANLRLLDPAWGGVYQYSGEWDWNHPHFEKTISSQSSNIHLYVQGYQVLGNDSFLKAAMEIHRYMASFLQSPEGVYYTSQDADREPGVRSADYFALGDKARRLRGVPAIDQSIYARENGWYISALVDLYIATTEESYLNEARKAARWIQSHRLLENGGFTHGAMDSAGPYLGDTLYMAIAFLALYQASAEREWITAADRSAQFIERHFLQTQNAKLLPGLLTVASERLGLLSPVRSLEENIAAARFFNLLAYYTGKESFRNVSKIAFSYLNQKDVALQNITEPGILLAADELQSEPLHVTIVGSKSAIRARALFLAAQAYFAPYKRLEWLDRLEGPLPNPDVPYPELPHAAAFICNNKRCSLPISDPAELAPSITRLRSG